ncbi:hypothetical protein vseg_010860 [Gypsophila vaccaria]
MPMARKSSMHKQRELNLRGRSVIRPTPTREQDLAEDDGEGTCITSPNGLMRKPSTDMPGKTKDINEIIGISELEVETDEEEEEELNEETLGGVKQINDHENRDVTLELDNTEPLLQLE